MAKVSKKTKSETPKLRRSQPDFFKIIGSKGGKATKKSGGKAYFSSIAKISHERRRERAAAQQPGQ